VSRAASVRLTRQLDAVLCGRLPLDDCPREAEPLLTIAAAMRLNQDEHLAAASLARGRQQLLAAISAGTAAPQRSGLPAWLRMPVLAGSLAAALSGGAVAYAAQGAAPDSPLYPVQQATQLVTQGVQLLRLPVPPAPSSPPASSAAEASASPAAAEPRRLSVAPAQPAEPARQKAAAAPSAAPADHSNATERKAGNGRVGQAGQARGASANGAQPAQARDNSSSRVDGQDVIDRDRPSAIADRNCRLHG